MSNTRENLSGSPSEISLKEAVLKIQRGIRYIKKRWLIILITGAIGGLIGLAYSIFSKPKFTASCTFVLDDGTRSSTLSQYAGLASMAGINLGGGASDGLFQGDNILELYKSRLMIEKTLLTPVDFGGKKELLIDRYIEYNKLRAQWAGKENIANITFNGDPEKFSRKQDSIITDLVEIFNKSVLTVTKPDKKLSIIRVDVEEHDELFAKNFVDKLVETVSTFYIQTKTKKASETVRILQKQADSVRIILHSTMSGFATAIDASPNANPALFSLKVPSERKQVDVQAITAIYTEIVKNLEISKMSLRQDTPLIQVIDKAVLPLKINRTRKITGILIGGIIGGFATILIIVIRGFFRYLMA